MAMLSILRKEIPPALPPLGFVFKINPLPETSTPFLVPVINKPNFDISKDLTPGIVQFAQGNLGVAQTVLGPIISAAESEYAGNPAALSPAQFVSQSMPTDAGLGSFEKMTFQSFMESQKPTMEMIQILIDMIAVVEDMIARFLGTSIKIPIINKWIGIPSKNPFYTTGALNYGDDNSMNKKFISNENRKGLNVITDTFPTTKDIYGGIPGNDKFDIDDYEDTQNAYYIGYFDENGKKAVPPAWVQNSDKWFGKIWGIHDNFEQVEQLSNIQDVGVQQLLNKYSSNLKLLDNEKTKLESQYDRQLQISQNQEERLNLSDGKKQSLKHLNDIIDEVNTGVIQTSYTEWFTKNSVAQIKSLYKEPFISTASPITDKKGRPEEPFVRMPKIKIKDDIEMEIPIIESENQAIRKKIKIGKKKQNVIVGLNTTKGKNGDVIIQAQTPEKTKVLYFEHKTPASKQRKIIKQTEIPEEVKNHYLTHDFEIILIFEIRKISTGEVLETEQEIYPQTIDFENDYLLRVVRVVNSLLDTSSLTSRRFSSSLRARKHLKSVTGEESVDPTVGTQFNSNNNIPKSYDTTQNGNNRHSAEILDEKNGLFEGEIKHGIDPRFNSFTLRSKARFNADGKLLRSYRIEQTRNYVFWLVEAFKIDEDGFVIINGKKYDVRSGAVDTKNDNVALQGGGKEWYGLLDKFTVIMLIVTKLVPKIAQKFIPLLIKVIQILTDPRKLADLVFLIITEKLSKFFGMFDTKFSERAAEDKEKLSGNIKEGKASKFNYEPPPTKDTPKPPSFNVSDGKASIEIFGFYIGISSVDGNTELWYSEKKLEEKYPGLPDQNIFQGILTMIKIPFDIIKKIIDFFLDFVKKLVNPLKMIPAIIEFITFKWLLDILNIDALLALISMPPLDNTQEYQKVLTAKEKDDMNNDIIRTLQSDPTLGEYIEVLVYHVFKNDEFVREEIEERPIEQDLTAASNFPPPGTNVTDAVRDILNRTNSANKDGPNNPSQPFPLSCGIRDIPLNTFFPLPMLSQSPNYNICDLIQVFMKPMEMILAILRIIQAFIQALIALPFALFGLAPTIPIPKIDFVSALENKIKEIVASVQPNIVPILT